MNRIFRLVFPENVDFYRYMAAVGLGYLALLAGRATQDRLNRYPVDYRTPHMMGNAGRGALIPPMYVPYMFGD